MSVSVRCLNRTRLITLISLSLCPFSRLVSQANPTGESVAQGSATFTRNFNGSQLTVQTSDRAFINWQSFNINQGETTTFAQPSSTSVVWNSIHDANPSYILGNLNANGYVILQNPSGFYVGGQAAITTHGLVMTTSPIPMPDLSSGGAWQFNALPPMASIINYGQINIAGGSQAFLIANDIENHRVTDLSGNVTSPGVISAPGGEIGLYAGKEVLLSTRADGRGLSARVKLPQGSVDNEGQLIADAGRIAVQAQVVNQGGLVQANSVRNVNGVIQLVAGDGLTLEATSQIKAQGDPQAGTDPALQVPSNAGFVALQGKTFTDAVGSLISVPGALGGKNGIVEIFGAASANSTIGTPYALLFNPNNITFSTAVTAISANPNLNVKDLSTYSQINLLAKNNMTVSSVWTLADLGVPSRLTLSAGNSIIVNDSASIRGQKNWSLSLSAGPTDLLSKPATPRTDGIYLDGTTTAGLLETSNGNIDLWAANEVIIAAKPSNQSGAIRTTSGGNISVTAQFGSVNAGGNPNGYVFTGKASPLYTVSPNLGGISTIAGGNVTINAGGDVISYIESQADYDGTSRGKYEGGSGAYGSQPGNVKITAGGKVSGHYVVANGVGTITANGGNIGAPLGQAGNFALSLIRGSWNVFAPNGSIYLQEVRNPNGVYNAVVLPTSAGLHYFDYDPQASVLLQAGNRVEITGGGPRDTLNAPVQIILPPSLSVIAGSGGFVMDQKLTLFPSPYQDLNITTLAGGDFVAANNAALWMSQSASRRWTGTDSFKITDSAPIPFTLNNPDPVNISISGNMNNVSLVTSKATHITVEGDMINCSFSGQNLRSSDVTSIDVAGRILNDSSLNFANLPAPIVGDLNTIFGTVVDSSIKDFDITGLTAQNIRNDLFGSFLLFQSVTRPASGLGVNPGFVYDPTTLRLGFNGVLTATALTISSMANKAMTALQSGVFTVLVLDKNGNPQADPQNPSRLLTRPYTFISPDSAPGVISDLETRSANARATTAPGYQIGGPGHFNITAGSLDLGDTEGIVSYGIGETLGGQIRSYASLAPFTDSGADVNVTVAGNIGMLTSRIASFFGGDVNVTSTGGGIDLGSQNFFITSSTHNAFGIYTTGHSDVKVTAQNDVDINGSRIGAYNGGSVTVESLYGNVNAGSGGNVFVNVPVIRPGFSDTTLSIYGSGILALSLPNAFQTGGFGNIPGNIDVSTPRGDIVADQAGILQMALSGNAGGAPTVTLTAGTPASDGNPAIPGNINLGQSGLIGGTVKVRAEGDIQGLIISRGNSDVSAAQNLTVTLLSAGTANVSAGGSVSGLVIGVGGANISGSVTAEVLGQNVSVNGGASQSTLAPASATGASQSAANQTTSNTQEQVANNNPDDDEKKNANKGPVLTRRIGRVTVILPAI
jgi:filamentous hemagglutinin family protein